MSKVLIVGSGGREHALAWKCAASPLVTQVLVAPGNAGTATEPRVRNVGISSDDIPALLALAQREQVALAIVGPEGPLVAGIVDAFAAAGLACFGPTRAAAQLEGSKAFTKAFLQRHRIPTGSFRTFTQDSFDRAWLAAQQPPIVVKASGLAAGKGVVIAHSVQEAMATVEQMFSGRFGAAGAEIVIEEFLAGEEASFIVMADGSHALPLATSQDHKRRDDGDQGPNTGGMGAYSPAPVVTRVVHERVMREIIEPTLRGLATDGMPFTGFLYAGLMIDSHGAPRVIEYNCRLGDPETQPLLMRLQSDLVSLCQAGLAGRLHTVQAQWDPRPALGVVMAAGGYPDAFNRGDEITGLDIAARMPGKLFHAGTQLIERRVVSSGGRVLCAVGMGGDIAQAREQAYALANTVRYRGAHFRRDIGYRALQRA